MDRYHQIVDNLANSDVPSISYRVRVGVLGENPETGTNRRLRDNIRRSPIVRNLLSERNTLSVIARNPYEKWQGAHWVLTTLADLDYPPGDPDLIPLRE